MKNNPVLQIIILAVIFFAAASGVWGYTLTVSDSGNEPFPAIRALAADGTLISLLDPDPLSSGWILKIDEKLISPAEDGWLRDFKKTDAGYLLSYSNRTFGIEQIAVVSAQGNHIRVTATITNNSVEPIRITPALLLDTSLGEVTGLPFHLPDGSYVSGETVYTASRAPQWIKTEKSLDTPPLFLILKDTASTKPDSIVLANWLRLKQSGYPYIPESGRNFDNLPFSEDDSAILLNYRESRLAPGASLEISLILGLNSRTPETEDFIRTQTADVDSELESRRLREYTLRRRIEEIQSVLDSLDYLLDNSEVISREAVLELEKAIAAQEKLRAEYENL